MVSEDFGLDELKKRYSEFQGKYCLPLFEDLNVCFDIEEIDVGSDLFLKRVRRILSERVSGYLKFIEIVLNPSGAPLFFFKLVKKLDESDRVSLTDLYNDLGALEIRMMKLDLINDDNLEAEFIKEMYKIFNERIKNLLVGLIDKMGNGESQKSEAKSNYCG